MFENIISLGCNCVVASSLSKNGFREYSSPFDWGCFKYKDSVLMALKNDFKDWFELENLRQPKDAHAHEIFDEKYRILFNHEITNQDTLENVYPKVKEKYNRRIARFKNKIKQPSLFIRYVDNLNEINEIVECEDELSDILMKFNPENRVIYIIPYEFFSQNPQKINSKYFIMNERANLFKTASVADNLRDYFDQNSELIDYLISNYSPEKRRNNLIFDLKQENQKLKEWINNNITRGMKSNIETLLNIRNSMEMRLNIWKMIANIDFSTIKFPDKIRIYGFGAIGRFFYKYAKDYCTISEIIDSNPRESSFDGIPEVLLNCADKENHDLIVITPSHDYDAIVSTIYDYYDYKPQTIRIEELLASGKIIDMNFQ